MAKGESLRSVRFGSLLVFGAVLGVAVLAGSRQSGAQANTCLVGIHDEGGRVTNNSELCGTAAGKVCTFMLKLCLNESEADCAPASIKGKKVKAKGHCGAVGKLAVKPSGTSSVCGAFVAIKAHTKKKGKKEGRCGIRVSARSTDRPARVDVEKVTLVCEPTIAPCSSTTTTTTSTSTTTTMCTSGCCCCDQLPSLLSFTTASSGCGMNPPGSVTPAVCVQGTNNGTDCTSDSDCTGGGVCRGHLDCTGLYFGAGQPAGIGLPGTIPDLGLSFSKIASCDTSGNPNLTSSLDTDVPVGCSTPEGTPTYGQRHCTSPGCLFGAPLAIPNPATTATGTCVVNVIANRTGVGTGTVECSTGAVSGLTLPLDSQIYLTGALEPVRVCSTCDGGTPGVCGSGTCSTGPRVGMPCTPETNALNGSYPTSHDCPPPNAPNDRLVSSCGAPSGSFIGCLPVDFGLSNGTQTKTAFSTSAQQRVFCGFCFDPNFTVSFEGPPPHPCTADADCTNGNFTSCQQQSNGAFRNFFATSISETGTTPNVCIGDGADHPATLVSLFCVPPSYNGIVDPSGELPGPGAVSLPGTSKFIP